MVLSLQFLHVVQMVRTLQYLQTDLAVQLHLNFLLIQDFPEFLVFQWHQWSREVHEVPHLLGFQCVQSILVHHWVQVDLLLQCHRDHQRHPLRLALRHVHQDHQDRAGLGFLSLHVGLSCLCHPCCPEVLEDQMDLLIQ